MSPQTLWLRMTSPLDHSSRMPSTPTVALVLWHDYNPIFLVSHVVSFCRPSHVIDSVVISGPNPEIQAKIDNTGSEVLTMTNDQPAHHPESYESFTTIAIDQLVSSLKSHFNSWYVSLSLVSLYLQMSFYRDSRAVDVTHPEFFRETGNLNSGSEVFTTSMLNNRPGSLTNEHDIRGVEGYDNVSEFNAYW